jgi:hypothetical protein
MLRPSKFSMTSIAILQQYSSTLNYSLQMLFWDVSQVGKCVTDIKILYETANIKNKIVDGDEVYPLPSTSAPKGMDIELRCVSSLSSLSLRALAEGLCVQEHLLRVPWREI